MNKKELKFIRCQLVIILVLIGFVFRQNNSMGQSETAEPMITLEPTYTPTAIPYETAIAMLTQISQNIAPAEKTPVVASRKVTPSPTPIISGQSTSLTLEDFGFLVDENFQGVLVSRDFTLNMPLAWSYTQNARITVKFSHSPALHPTSTMTLDWNGQRVGSVMLTKDNADNGELSVDIPAQSIIRGYNTLRVQFYMGISDNFCYDYDNPAIWAVVHKNSTFEFTPETDFSIYDLSNAPDLLFDQSPIASNEIDLIIPDQPDQEMISSIARVGTRIGQMTDWRNVSMKVYTVSEAQQNKVSGNLIAVMNQDQARSAFPEIMASNQANVPSQGFMAMGISPFSADRIALLLTGSDNAAVNNACLGFISDGIFQQASGTWAAVASIPDYQEAADSDTKVITFADIGYQDQTAYGTREQRITYTLLLNSLWYFNNEATMEVYFKHSALLNHERSTLSIQINSIPVSSVALDETNADNGYQKAIIPLRYFTQGVNTIAFVANLQDEANIYDTRNYCTDDRYLRNWITIGSNSRITYPDRPTETSLSIANFPFIFVERNQYSKALFVIPDKYSGAELKTVARAGFVIGKNVPGNASDLNVELNGNLTDPEKKYHSLIYVGLAEKSFLKEINDYLPAPFDLTTGKLTEKNSVIVLLTANGKNGIIEAFSDAAGRKDFLLTSSSNDGLGFTADVINNHTILSSLYGNAAVVTSSDRASSFWGEKGKQITIQTVYPKETETASQDQLFGKPSWITIGAAGVILIALFIFLAVFLASNRRK